MIIYLYLCNQFPNYKKNNEYEKNPIFLSTDNNRANLFW